MASGTLTVQLRPLRLAFLVDPKDEETLKKVFEMNTLLWGGIYNPIIPVFTEAPQSWWNGDIFKPEPEEIINGYIDAFDPDYLVKAVENLPAKIEFPQGRVIQFEEITKNFGENYDIAFGICRAPLKIWAGLIV